MLCVYEANSLSEKAGMSTGRNVHEASRWCEAVRNLLQQIRCDVQSFIPLHWEHEAVAAALHQSNAFIIEKHQPPSKAHITLH